MTFDPQRKRGGNQREFVPSESVFCSGYVLSSVTGQVLARPRCHRGTGRETDRVSERERGEERAARPSSVRRAVHFEPVASHRSPSPASARR